ncbi:MAG: hypothetical protein IJ466_11610 [Clostridia bacterium]|nr:hypothetical protein [Clostridia bacterium]
MAIKDSGERTEFTTGAQRDMHAGKGRFDLLPWHAIHDVAKHCEEGALKYGERNVDRGIPQHSFIDSAFRHLKKYWTGETDEPHLRAAAWNILWALEQETTHPDLVDMPEKNADTPESVGGNNKVAHHYECDFNVADLLDVIRTFANARGMTLEEALLGSENCAKHMKRIMECE